MQQPNLAQLNSLATSSPEEVGLDTAALLPKDMTVRLVRADSATAEIFLSSLYSLLLTIFGLFLGAWITDSQSTNPHFSFLEKGACILFGVLALIIIIAWVILKIKQTKHSVRIPLKFLSSISQGSD